MELVTIEASNDNIGVLNKVKSSDDNNLNRLGRPGTYFTLSLENDENEPENYDLEEEVS